MFLLYMCVGDIDILLSVLLYGSLLCLMWIDLLLCIFAPFPYVVAVLLVDVFYYVYVCRDTDIHLGVVW